MKEVLMYWSFKLNRDELGIVELYEIETYAPIVPYLYQPEFYYIGKDSKESVRSKYRGSNIPTPTYKTFTPKNTINQVIITKEEDSFTTVCKPIQYLGDTQHGD